MIKKEAKALWFEKPGLATIKSTPLQNLAKEYCQIKTECSAISLGTEKLVFNGHVPKELWTEMSVPYMRGNFSFPIQYGYSLVGRITHGPKHLTGRRVHLLHPHQTCCQVRIEDVHLVPDGISAARASLASNLETAVNAIWDSGVQIGDRVVVVGFGTIGSLIARLLYKIPGVSLTVVDSSIEKCQLSQDMGFHTILPAELAAMKEKADLAFHTSASAAGLQTALDSIGLEAKVIELSWYGTKMTQISLGGTFHSMRKQIVSSQVSNISTSQRARWDYGRRKNLVFKLLQDPAFDRHITHTVSFAELPEIYSRLGQISETSLYCVVNYPKSPL